MSPLMERTLLLVAVLACLQVTTALYCYECNSEYDRNCGDPFDAYLSKVNCSKKEPSDHLRDRYQPILCRKTVQKVNGKIRIVRGCGYIPDKSTDNNECLIRSGARSIQVQYCACTSTSCNHSASTLNNKNNYLIHLLPYTLAALFIMFSRQRINFHLKQVS